MDEHRYNKEYLAYMQYALEQYLIENHDYSEHDARIKVMQDYDFIADRAQKAGFLP